MWTAGTPENLFALRASSCCGAGVARAPSMHKGCLAQRRAAAMYSLRKGTFKPTPVQPVAERCQASEKVCIRQPLPET